MVVVVDLIFTAKEGTSASSPYQLFGISLKASSSSVWWGKSQYRHFLAQKDVDIQLHFGFSFVGHSLIHLVGSPARAGIIPHPKL